MPIDQRQCHGLLNALRSLRPRAAVLESDRSCFARNHYQVFAISLDGGPESDQFLDSKGLGMEAFVNIDSDMREIYKLTLAPLTIVIDSTGQVEKIWPLRYTENYRQARQDCWGA